MIEYFNIPSGALINTPISKKLFAEKAPLSAGEKRLLREEIEKLTMKGLLQTRTIGLAAYMDDEQAYDQIIIAEVSIKNPAKAMPVATMVQKAFPAPMFLVIHCDESFSVNWCCERFGYGVKAEYDTDKYAIGLTYFGAKDREDDNNRVIFDSLGVYPMQNSVIGINTRIGLVNDLTLIAEYTVSLLTRNQYAPKKGDGFIDNLFNQRTSTNTYKAFNARINYQLLKNTIGIGYERIDPDYQTLGAYYFNSDFENITLNYARPFLKDDKANVAVSFGIQRDNLNKDKEESTNRYVGSVNLNYAPTENLQLTANYSTFQSHRNIKSQFDYINETSPYQNLDTLNFTQLSQNIDASVMYTFKKTEVQSQRANLNFSYQEAADRQGGISIPGNVSRFINSALGYGISFIPQGININSSFNASYNYGGGTESYTLGPTIGVNANLFKKTLMTGFSTSYNVNLNDGDVQAKVLNLRLNASYRILKKHNINASFIWQSRDITNKKKTHITTTTISYLFNF